LVRFRQDRVGGLVPDEQKQSFSRSAGFVVVAPQSTLDADARRGADIPIEERDPAEVTQIAGADTTIPGTRTYNPAFDITPAELITAIVTERRTWRPVRTPRPLSPRAT
jgi:methylthioribose-1-phosphate isomerase